MRHSRIERSHRQYWWLTGKLDGKTFLIFGSDVSEDDARRKGLEMLSGIDFEIKKLPTRNTARASQILKGGILEQDRDLRRATRRLRHKNI